MLSDMPWGWFVIGFLVGAPIWSGLAMLVVSLASRSDAHYRRNKDGNFEKYRPSGEIKL